jgi:hypothetical protein
MVISVTYLVSIKYESRHCRHSLIGCSFLTFINIHFEKYGTWILSRQLFKYWSNSLAGTAPSSNINITINHLPE